MSSKAKYPTNELDHHSVQSKLDLRLSFKAHSTFNHQNIKISKKRSFELIQSPISSDWISSPETSSYLSNDLSNTKIPNSNSSHLALDLPLNQTNGFRLSILDQSSSTKSNHHQQEERRSSMSDSDRSRSYQSTLRSNSMGSNETDEIEFISNHQSDQPKEESLSDRSTQVIDESFEQRNLTPIRRFSMIEDDFKSSHTFSNPIQQPRITLETNPTSQIDGHIGPGITRRSKAVAISMQSNPLASQSISQTKISLNRPIGLRTMSSAHELRALRAPQRDVSFDSWLEDVCTRACTNPNRSSRRIRNQTSFTRLSTQSQVISSVKPTIVLKEEIAALKTAVISLNGLQGLMSNEIIQSEEIIRENSSNSSCGTTACEVKTEDLIQPIDFESQTRLINQSTISIVQRCILKTQFGNPISFNEILGKSHRTIVIFIRFFWCSLCQTYVKEISNKFSKTSNALQKLNQTGTRIILIGTGDWRMITSYRAMLNCPFEIYSDSSSNKSIFKQFGLERTMKGGKDSEKGDYLKEINKRKVITQSILNIKKMPFRNPGSFTQLGGEFCFESNSKLNHSNQISESSIRIKNKRFSHLSLRPTVSVFKPKLEINDQIRSDQHYQKTHVVTDSSVKCVYANRMTNSRDHGSIEKLFNSIGLQIFD